MTNQSSGNDSYTMSAAGSYAGSSYSLSSYVFQGNSMGSSSASDASRESSSSGSSSQGRSQSGQESDSLYQAGSQGCFGGYSNASYAYQDTARSTVSNAASGPSYASSDSWVQTSNVLEVATGSSTQSSGATYSYQTGQGSGTWSNSTSAAPSNSSAGAVVQFASPDVGLVPTYAPGNTSSGSAALVAANVSLQQVSNGQVWLTTMAQSGTVQINQSSNVVSGGLTPAGQDILLAAVSPAATPAQMALGADVVAAVNFMPAPAMPQMSNFNTLVWNALHPLFVLTDRTLGSPSYALQSSLQQVLKIQTPSGSMLGSSGDGFVDWVDQMLYNNSQPLTVGSAPLYGTYWDGMGHSAQEALSMAAPYVAGGVMIVAGSWLVGPAALLGLTGPAAGALMGAGQEIVTNWIAGGNSGMLASSVGSGFLAGAIFGSLDEVGNQIGSFGEGLSGAKSWDGALGKAEQRLGELQQGGALTEVGSFARSEMQTLTRTCGASPWSQACFAAGTPLLTPEGSKPIEEFQVGDLLLSRDENRVDGPVEAKVVEEVFVRTAPIMELRVGGRVIQTTGAHPFYVRGKGWRAAEILEIGDELATHDGQWVGVEGVENTGNYKTVYNLRVAGYHTYFVGGLEWGFSVWAYNANYGRTGKQPKLKGLAQDPNVSSADRGWFQQELNQIARGKRSTVRLPGSSRLREINGVGYGGLSGKVLAHRRGFAAKNGFGYQYSDLQDVDLHKLQHSIEGY